MTLTPTPGQTIGPFYGYALPYPGDDELVPRVTEPEDGGERQQESGTQGGRPDGVGTASTPQQPEPTHLRHQLGVVTGHPGAGRALRRGGSDGRNRG